MSITSEMVVVRTREALDGVLGTWRGAGDKIAFVPTMGALHDGHLSLVTLAQERGDRCVVSIFVNPKQFGPSEDFSTYPRDEAGDLAKIEALGADLVYIPNADVLYPDGWVAAAKAGAAASGLETDFRPGFFDGVVDVVGELFAHVQPDIAVFGEKDYQQLQVVTEAFPDIQIEGAPIVRDAAGLALSSRNAYLSQDEIAVARQFNVILREAAKSGDMEQATARLLEIGFDKVDYVAERWGRVLAAAWIGKTRLIDNVPME